MKKHRKYPSLISPIIPPPNFSRWRNGRPERYPQAHLWRQIWPSSPLERLFEQLLCGCLWYIWGDTICSGCYVYCIGCFSSRLSRKVPSSVFPNWKCFKSFAILHAHRKQSRKTAIECKWYPQQKAFYLECLRPISRKPKVSFGGLVMVMMVMMKIRTLIDIILLQIGPGDGYTLKAEGFREELSTVISPINARFPYTHALEGHNGIPFSTW